MQSVKWKKVQRSMRNKDQMAGCLRNPERRDELGVKPLEMTQRGAQQRLLELLRIFCAQAKFRKLESEQLQDLRNARGQGNGRDLDVIARDKESQQAISRRIVFNERSAVR